MVQPSRPGRAGGAAPARGPLVIGVIVLLGMAAWALGGAGGSTDEPEIPATLPSSGTDETVPDLPSLERLLTTEAFWAAVGTGDIDEAAELLDPDGGAALANYISFIAAFEAGFEAGDCTPIAANAVRCTLEATNADLVSLYHRRTGQDTYRTSASITYNERGIDFVDLPGIVGSASIRLLQHARSVGSFPDACDRTAYPPEELPPFSTSMAQTGSCGRALAEFLPEAVAAPDD
jgi:hypothetical protein